MSEKAKDTAESLREAAREVVAGLDSSVVAFTAGAEKLSKSSEKFAKKSPGIRASWLGYLLLIFAIAAEFAESFTGGGFKFSDTMSTNMIYVGGFLIVVGVVLDVYFSLKAIEAESARAMKLEEQAAEARKTVSSIRAWLAGQ